MTRWVRAIERFNQQEEKVIPLLIRDLMKREDFEQLVNDSYMHIRLAAWRRLGCQYMQHIRVIVNDYYHNDFQKIFKRYL